MTFRCAEASAEAGEPLWGTAPFASRWELVQRPKPWGRDHGLTIEDGKVLLVERVRGSERHALGDGRTYLVCTNGARDRCCAIRGPAVAAAIERARPGRAWECSHVGGHRFAANLLVLPDALCFARLDVASALALVDELEAGRLPLEHFRGRTDYSQPDQAAEILVRKELGLTGLDDLALVEACGSEPQARFAVRDGREVTATIRGERLSPVRTSCRDDNVEAPTRWVLDELVLA
jgi:hypothetical protein